MITTKGKVSGHGIHSPLIYSFCSQILYPLSRNKQSDFLSQMIREIKTNIHFQCFNINPLSSENIQDFLSELEVSILNKDTQNHIFYSNSLSKEKLEHIIEINYPYYIIEYQEHYFFITSNKILHKECFILR